MTTPRYVRFIQALLLAAAVPACGVEVGTPSPDATAAQAVHDPAASANNPNQVVDQDGGASLDGGAEGPFSSGPIIPPQEQLVG